MGCGSPHAGVVIIIVIIKVAIIIIIRVIIIVNVLAGSYFSSSKSMFGRKKVTCF